MTVTNWNCIHEEIKSKLNLENAYYHFVQNLLSSHLLSKNLKIKIYETIILPVVLCGCETWSLILREQHRLCLRAGCWGEYLDLRGRKWWEVGEDHIMRSLTTCMLHQILLGWPTQEWWNGQGMYHAWERWEMCTNQFVVRLWSIKIPLLKVEYL